MQPGILLGGGGQIYGSTHPSSKSESEWRIFLTGIKRVNTEVFGSLKVLFGSTTGSANFWCISSTGPRPLMSRPKEVEEGWCMCFLVRQS